MTMLLYGPGIYDNVSETLEQVKASLLQGDAFITLHRSDDTGAPILVNKASVIRVI